MWGTTCTNLPKTYLPISCGIVKKQRGIQMASSASFPKEEMQGLQGICGSYGVMLKTPHKIHQFGLTANSLNLCEEGFMGVGGGNLSNLRIDKRSHHLGFFKVYWTCCVGWPWIAFVYLNSSHLFIVAISRKIFKCIDFENEKGFFFITHCQHRFVCWQNEGLLKKKCIYSELLLMSISVLSMRVITGFLGLI